MKIQKKIQKVIFGTLIKHNPQNFVSIKIQSLFSIFSKSIIAVEFPLPSLALCYAPNIAFVQWIILMLDDLQVTRHRGNDFR